MASLSQLSTKARKFLRLVSKTRVSLPHEFQIEITNRCNLDCDMCPRLSILKVPEVDMAPELFYDLVENLQEPRSVTLTGWGEPLMHPQFFDFIDRLHNKHPSCQIAFTSNGHLLNAKTRAQILERKISRLTISLEELPWEEQSIPAEEARKHGFNPQKGQGNAIAKSGHPSSQRVVENLQALVRERRERNSQLELRLQVVLVPDGAETLKRLIAFGAETGLDVINLVRLDVRQRPDLQRPSWDEERQLLQLAKQSAAKLGIRCDSVNDHNLLMQFASHFDRFCMRLDDYVYITVDGQVSACCLLRNQSLGDLKEESLRQIWNKPEFREYYGPSLPEACNGCDAFMNDHKIQQPANFQV